ncbi:hypothetical protein PsYK624_128300 [Phanerochaete sordida]|uniref:Uncharacterized protein n=1 Tax=Phanerochaete sordida TaxID=48140 RepID=A0A9P3GNF5_9APHY|nr:hypothetical protein PsYK624_128300 [Phanerochaete sordida]
MSAGTNASIILAMCLLAMMVFLGYLMTDFQLRLNRLDREALEVRGIRPGYCAGCQDPLPRHWRIWAQAPVACSPSCMREATIAEHRRAKAQGDDTEPGKGSHFQEMIYEVPASV